MLNFKILQLQKRGQADGSQNCATAQGQTGSYLVLGNKGKGDSGKGALVVLVITSFFVGSSHENRSWERQHGAS
jgi:hypothetical protein